jgi:hypothetical protein
MGQTSSIEKLPPEIKSELQRLLQDPRVTQLEVTEKINALLEEEGHDDRISKSAVNRYSMRMEEVGQKLRQSREISEMFIAKVGAAPQGQTGLLINEILRTLAFDITLKIQDADIQDPETLSATIDQVKALALATQRLEQSATINVKRAAEIKKQALEEAAKTIEKTATAAGVTPEAIQMIRRDVLMMAE